MPVELGVNLPRSSKAWIGGLASSELAESKRVERGETVHGAQVSSC